MIGHWRYDTEEERKTISDLYRNELRLYKNFFQPVIKLTEKKRIKGKIKKKYETPKTPYRRLMESDKVSNEKKKELKNLYDTLNSADLRRKIESKLSKLYKVHQKGSQKVDARQKKLTPTLVSYYIGQPI